MDVNFVWRWEIDIPQDWEYPQWERIRLYPVQVDILTIKCECCDEKFMVYPSFIIEGTTLTLSALIFVAFAYESSDLVWRDLPEKFCDENDKIAHSTLYRAVHGLGKSIADSDNKIRNSINELAKKYLSPNKRSVVWPPEKSLYAHTLQRENAIRGLLLPFVSTQYDFIRLFFTYTRSLRTVLSNVDPPVLKLYT